MAIFVDMFDNLWIVCVKVVLILANGSIERDVLDHAVPGSSR